MAVALFLCFVILWLFCVYKNRMLPKKMFFSVCIWTDWLSFASLSARWLSSLCVIEKSFCECRCHIHHRCYRHHHCHYCCRLFLLNLVVNLHLHVIKFVCSLQSITRKIGHTTYKWMQIYTIKQYECEYYYSPQTRTWIHNFYCRRVLLRLHLLIRKNIYNIKIHSNKNFEWNLKFV